eukprot:1150484-Pelagomonas_calceolata.AAC.3
MPEVPDWRLWASTDGSCHIQDGKQGTGAGVYCPLTDSKKLSSPTVPELPTPYVELNLQQLLLLSRTLIHTLLQIVSPLFIKYGASGGGGRWARGGGYQEEESPGVSGHG